MAEMRLELMLEGRLQIQSVTERCHGTVWMARQHLRFRPGNRGGVGVSQSLHIEVHQCIPASKECMHLQCNEMWSLHQLFYSGEQPPLLKMRGPDRKTERLGEICRALEGPMEVKPVRSRL